VGVLRHPGVEKSPVVQYLVEKISTGAEHRMLSPTVMQHLSHWRRSLLGRADSHTITFRAQWALVKHCCLCHRFSASKLTFYSISYRILVWAMNANIVISFLKLSQSGILSQSVVIFWSPSPQTHYPLPLDTTGARLPDPHYYPSHFK